MKSLLALAALAIATTINCFALGVGDPAPELQASKWLKGDAVTKLESTNIYVVEFWATWCGPCVQTIPHLTEMAAKHKGKVTFIGMDIWERGDNKVKVSEDFVKKMGAKMEYNVAMDTTNNFMAKNWMEAAKQNGIPTAFIVSGGKIVWIGHPGGMEEILDKVVAGTFDINTAQKKSNADKKLQAFIEKAMEGKGTEEELMKEAKELEALDKEMGGILPGGQPFDAAEIIKMVKFQRAMQKYEEAVSGGKSAEEIAKAEAAARALSPKELDFDEIKDDLVKMSARMKEAKRIGSTIEEYFQVITESGDKDKAAALAKKIEELNIKDSEILNQIAWMILDNKEVKHRDLVFATKLAKAGVEESKGKESAVIDTYARALFDSGKVADAVEQQKKAVAACENEEMKADLEKTLKKYQAALPKADDKK